MGGSSKRVGFAMSNGGGSSSASKVASGPFVDIDKVELQPFMNGFDDAIAQQLSYGYGGEPDDYLAGFQNIYTPMRVPVFPVPEDEE